MSDKREHNGWISISWVAWLFTIGFMDLSFWQVVWALVIWPCYLGIAAARLVW